MSPIAIIEGIMKTLLQIIVMLILCAFHAKASTQTVYMNVGDTRTLSFNASHVVGTQWTITDKDAIMFTSTPGAMSTSASIKALSPRSAANRCTVHCTYYYNELDPTTGRYEYQRTGYQAWDIIINGNGAGGGDNSATVTLGLQNYQMSVGQTTNIMAYASDNSYMGNYNWTSSDQNILSIIEQTGPMVSIKGISEGTSYLRVTLDNGNYDEMFINVTSNGGGININQFKFTLNDDGNGYTISAKNPEKISGSLEIPAYYNNLPVTKIGEEGFKYSSITRLVLPNTITVIGNYAFQFNNLLTYVNLGSNLEEIHHCAFYGCFRLSNIEFPPTLHTIRTHAFEKCSALQSIYLPNSVVRIWDNPFSYCTNLTEINYEDADPLKSPYLSKDGILYETDFKGNPESLIIYPSGKIGDFEIPKSVTIIGSEAFAGNDKIHTVKFNNVTSVNPSAFEDCAALEDIYLSKSMNFIGVYSFRACLKTNVNKK